MYPVLLELVWTRGILFHIRVLKQIDSEWRMWWIIATVRPISVLYEYEYSHQLMVQQRLTEEHAAY